MSEQPGGKQIVRSSLLLLIRIIAGGSLLLAGILKLKGDPFAFALAIESFELFPKLIIPSMAYFVPMFEIVLGVAMLGGMWARQAGLLAVVLFGAFTIALASVLLRDMNIDCGCFGDMFGSSDVSWTMIFRNSIFLITSGIVAWFGAGNFAISCAADKGCPFAPESKVPDQESESTG